MTRTICTYYATDDLEIEFVANYGSYDDVTPDVDILSLSIFGVKVNPSQLPKELRQAILEIQPETL